MKTIEHISGCLTVRLTALGGMTVTLLPVCSVDDGIIPDNCLMTVDGIPLITEDGCYLIVVNN